MSVKLMERMAIIRDPTCATTRIANVHTLEMDFTGGVTPSIIRNAFKIIANHKGVPSMAGF